MKQEVFEMAKGKAVKVVVGTATEAAAPVRRQITTVSVEKAANGYVVSKGSEYDHTKKTIICKDVSELSVAIKKML